MVGIQKWGAEIIDTSCRWSVKSMPHPPPSFLLPSSCASDRLCVGVHERKRRRRERDGKKSSYLCKSWHERRYSAESLSMIKALLNQSKLTFNPFINPIINYHLNVHTQTPDFPTPLYSPLTIASSFLTHSNEKRRIGPKTSAYLPRFKHSFLYPFNTQKLWRRRS